MIFSVTGGILSTEAISLDFIDKIKSPFETLSPTLTFNFSIIPLSVEGTSTLDLSLSKVIKGSLIFT